MTALWIAIGAFFGAMTRFAATRLSKRVYGGTFPWATLFVNVSGSFLLGYLSTRGLSDMWMLLLGVGFLGSFTTFSTLKLEMYRLSNRQTLRFVVYTSATYVLGLTMAYVGIVVGR